MVVSILIAVKNEEKYLTDAINSIINCDYDFPIEIIVVDDSSTDGSRDILKSISDDRFKYYLATGQGKVSAFNQAYSLASGDFFVFFAGDDLFIPQNLSLRVRNLTVNYPKVSTSRLLTMSENRKFDGISIPKRLNKISYSGGAIAFNRHFANLLFPIPISLPNEDTWLYCVIVFFDVEVDFVNDYALIYRIHGGNSHRRDLTFDKYSSMLEKRESAYLLFYEKFGGEINKNLLKDLELRISLSIDRKYNSSLSILFKKFVPIRTKLSFFLLSSKSMYRLKSVLYRWLVGF